MVRRKLSVIAKGRHFDHCYICHRPLKKEEIPFSMCSECYAANQRKLQQLQCRDTTMAGMMVLVTGARIKIGYQVGLSLLRKGATVLITTRFPANAAEKYSKENDFAEWSDRLLIYGIDFRDIRKVEEMIAWMNAKLPYLNIIINNAAQTIARPEEYYRHLRDLEKHENHRLSPVQGKLLRYYLEQKQNCGNIERTFMPDKVDEDGFLEDLRTHNSWISKAWNVSLREFLEVQLVNVTAPFLFCSRLVELLKKAPVKEKFIVNVSAMEGCFSKKNKNPFHPHTNMAKAALNMLTKTVAEDYLRLGIYVNSVDTGWITDENPYPIAKRNLESGFTPPLTVADGAARVCDPFLSYFYSGKKEFLKSGLFLKDYHGIKW